MVDDEEGRIAHAVPFEQVPLRAGMHMSAKGYLLPATQREGQSTFSDGCKGALLAVAVTYEDAVYAHGTGFMIMPGLAMTASHVYSDLLEEFGDPAGLFVLGTVDDALYPWAVTQAHMFGDIALLEVKPQFDLPDNFELGRELINRTHRGPSGTGLP